MPLDLTGNDVVSRNHIRAWDVGGGFDLYVLTGILPFDLDGLALSDERDVVDLTIAIPNVDRDEGEVLVRRHWTIFAAPTATTAPMTLRSSELIGNFNFLNDREMFEAKVRFLIEAEDGARGRAGLAYTIQLMGKIERQTAVRT